MTGSSVIISNLIGCIDQWSDGVRTIPVIRKSFWSGIIHHKSIDLAAFHGILRSKIRRATQMHLLKVIFYIR